MLANHFPVPGSCTDGKQNYIRDSEGVQVRKYKPRKKRALDDAPTRVPGDLSLCPRWAALRRRIVDKAGVG